MNAPDNKDIAVIVVAAGSGSRFGGAVAKQFCLLGDRPLLMHSIDAFRNALPGCRVVVALAPEMRGVWDDLCREYGYVSPAVTEGGATRAESVRNALAAVPDDTHIIMVHDAARPLVSRAVISGVLAAAAEHGAAVPVVPVTDSLRRADTGMAVDRAPFRAVQTPQAFLADVLRRAYAAPLSPSFTAAASVVEAAGHPVTMVDGSPENIKITWPRDIAVAAALMNAADGPEH